MYEEDLTLNNLEWFICHEPQTNQNKDIGILLFLV